MSAPPREAFAAITRKVIEDHDKWDSPHAFITLHWDGEKLTAGTFACIDPAINPPDYPALMCKLARARMDDHPGDPACGYLLQIEGWGVAEPEKDAAPAEREQYERARISRTFHQMPDAVESVMAYCADIHGRLWAAAKRRDKPGEISENFYPPGSGKIGGQMVRGLLAVAYGTGMVAHGLPGPQAPLN